MFGAAPIPTAALAFKATLESENFRELIWTSLFFSMTPLPQRSGAILRDRAAQFGRNHAPIVDPLAVAQDVTKKGPELLGAGLLQGAGAQCFEPGFALSFPDRSHDVAVFAFISGDKVARGPRHVAAIQEPDGSQNGPLALLSRAPFVDV
jgi:hypothetical protein